MSDDGQTSSAAPARRPVARLSLEEKLWMDKRKSDLQTYSAFGGGLGLSIATAITILGPFNRRMQAATMLGSLAIGGCAGYLYADTKALERIQDLSAQSRLRKEYQQLVLEKKASKSQSE
ncbi:hypothetical protein Poli38472_008198 [Pythium oligandrum]|uniref:Uncharacterized protein n=1 Tax=Pythium oligandrum TaxID=41045 RepID=A0A8K1CKZ9_PYTOL|nr:hypothetical protein Poli38472_008198 [Pythium oligandrum]|eukprot:TMW65556.1 hypothetical protein Poli38472_008198 [Pythium oligandrum]